MNEERERKEMIIKYSELQAKLEALLKERNEILEKIEEIEDTLSSLEELKENVDSLFSVGSGVYCWGKVMKDRFLVSIGARVLVEVDKKDVVNILRKREDTLKSVIREIEKEIENIVSQQKKLAEGIKKGS
jgi:prefoldin alpha subunit